MRLLKWTPDFDVHHESPIVPVWVSFPNLRLHFFNSQVLFGLASILGRPLQTDQATASVSRPSVARILVEVDISKKFPNEIWLGSELNGYFQKVEFENFPIFCMHCKMHGHNMNDCFKLHPNLKISKEQIKPSLVQEVNTIKGCNQNMLEEYGKKVEDLPTVHGGIISSDITSPVVGEVGEGIVNEMGKGNDFQEVGNNMIPNLSLQPAFDSNRTITHAIVEEVNNIVNINTNVIVESNQVEEDGLQALVNAPTNSLVIVPNIVTTEAESMDIPQPIVEYGIGSVLTGNDKGEPSGNTKANKGKSKMEGIGSVLTSMEDGVFYLEDESPSKGPSGNLNDKTMLLSDFYPSDAYTDTEIDILAKCYAREDNDLSFSKGRGKKGRKPRSVILKSPRSTRSNTSH
ncbi:hypothetical protein MA16_Dca008520 [Dendrobium catenatum]|uniref:Uncharacterized protein n=1 Tax=Dendrobium catenatum TaxID=906689 RepID=A0A2I0XHR6_9ASPA|nr:hypothetical protein MA16_Dca008520 [Dendrobium catenatum]